MGELEAFSERFDVLRAALALVLSIVTVLGAVIGKAKPNALVGIRVPWTRDSRLAWDKANRMGGRILFLGGLVGIAGLTLLPTLAMIVLLLVLVAVAVSASLVEAHKAWSTDPART
jgi:uncharacterized membrane protein